MTAAPPVAHPGAMAEQRVAVLESPEQMRVETRAVPEPGPGQVQVRSGR